MAETTKTRSSRSGASARKPATGKAAARKPAAKGRAASKPVARPGVVERAALTYVGATLEARDALVARVDLERFERRGSTARTRVEREAKRARTRVERELRNRRREAERLVRRNRGRLEREVRTAQHELSRPRTLVGRQFGRVSHQVESVVHAGVSTGERLVAKARGQISTAA